MNSLHIISTGKQSKKEFIEKVIQVHSSVDYIHLRERSWNASDYIEVIGKLVGAGIRKDKIIVNDRIDIAVTERIGGVQLASHSIEIQKVKQYFPDLYTGCSVHSVIEAKEKERLGADFLIFGHIFETNSKVGLPPRGLKQLKDLTSSVTIPVIAIGGIKPSNVQSILDMGASGIAVLSGILLDDSPNAVLKYTEKLRGGISNETTY